MLILAFDTTSERGGVGLFRDGECLASIENQGRANYSVTLFQMVERLVEEVRVRNAALLHSLRDVELFAVANGPGSFTGIRVGVAAAQGWATAVGRPLVGVSVLAAMVNEARPETDRAAAILDARRGEFFLALFARDVKGHHILYLPEREGAVLKPDALQPYFEQALARGATVTCLAREHDQAALKLKSLLPKSFQWKTVSGTLVPAIARLALEAHRQGKLQSPAQLDACYVRRSDSELKWRE